MNILQMLSNHLAGSELFEHLQQAPPDPILDTAIAFKADKHPDKMNLGIGAYKDDFGQSVVFETVRKAEREVLESNPNKQTPVYNDSTRSYLFLFLFCFGTVFFNILDHSFETFFKLSSKLSSCN